MPDALADPMRRALNSTYAEVPIINEKQVSMAGELIIQYQNGLMGASEKEIERMLGKIALIYPGVKLSESEASIRLDLYIDLLSDIPFDCLSIGFREVAKSSKFFPTVAEIREHAEPMLTARNSKIWALRNLISKHKQEWQPPFNEDERCSPEEAAEILRKFKIGSRGYNADLYEAC